MALDLKHLDCVRQHMVAEIQADIARDELYYSKFLTPEGRQQWQTLLVEAAQHHDEAWLAEQLRGDDVAFPQISSTDSRGYNRTLKFQPETLADSEFNRYYIRGLCLYAMERHVPYIITYRAKEVHHPLSPVDTQIAPHDLLEDLRTHKEQTELGVPSNPNSGISVMLP